MNEQEKLAFGIEIVSAMKASCYDWDIETGRIGALMETEVDRMEGYTRQWWDGLSFEEKTRYKKFCQHEKEKLHKQALFVADIALNYLSKP